MRTHDQTQDRHLVMVPMMLNKATLLHLMQGEYSDTEEKEHFADHIMEESQVSLNPSSSLGHGACIVEMLSLGLMCYAKQHKLEEIDPADLWWHPCSRQTPKRVVSIDIEYEDVSVIDPALVIYAAIDGNTGETVTSDEVGAEMMGANEGLAALAKEIGMPAPRNCAEGEVILAEAVRREEEEDEDEGDEDVEVDMHRNEAQTSRFNNPNYVSSWVRVNGEYHLLHGVYEVSMATPSSTVFPVEVITNMFNPEQVARIAEYSSLADAISDDDLPF